MSGLLSGLEEFGLGELSKMDVLEDQNAAKKGALDGKAAEIHEKTEDEYLFDKNFTCPVCDREFKAKAIRTGKAKLLGTDTDLRPRYQGIDPLKYDAVVCPHCGYAALTRFFANMTSTQSKLIRETISPKFKAPAEPEKVYSYDDAIVRHRLALVSAMVERAKLSERAYICLKTAWLIRCKAELSEKEEEKAELAAAEKEFLSTAYDGFTEALTKENLPMCGMDEITIDLMLCDVGRRLGRYEESFRLISKILTTRGVNERVKNHARDIKEMIEEERKQGKPEN